MLARMKLGFYRALDRIVEYLESTLTERKTWTSMNEVLPRALLTVHIEEIVILQVDFSDKSERMEILLYGSDKNTLIQLLKDHLARTGDKVRTHSAQICGGLYQISLTGTHQLTLSTKPFGEHEWSEIATFTDASLDSLYDRLSVVEI